MFAPLCLAVFFCAQSKAPDSDLDFNTLIETQEKQISSVWSLDLKYEVRYEVSGQDDYDIRYFAMLDKRKIDVVFKSGLRISDVISNNINKSFSIHDRSGELGFIARGTIVSLSGKQDQFLLSMPRDINWIGLLFVSNSDNEKIPINKALKKHQSEMQISRNSKERDLEYCVSWIQKKKIMKKLFTHFLVNSIF